MSNVRELDRSCTANAADKSLGLVILDQNFKGDFYEVTDPVVSGRDIIRLGKKRPAKSYIVLRQLASGQVEEVGLDEKLPLQNENKDRFFVIKGDRTYRFVVDGYRLSWPNAELSGKDIRKLALKDNDFDVWQENEDTPDKSILPEEKVTLTGRGVESFFTKAKVKLVEVIFNDESVTLEKRKYTYQELFQVFGVVAGYVLQQVLSNGEFEPLNPGDTIKAKDGLVFFSHAPEGQSS
ncbi:multiubiquitin domain-containing protein [Kordiimonas pumila]|uniref:Multiubiquitin domain-containing protein n=1 Tax=Kordiimonas pumila TaxID=2161677 RepID=A0ABV7D650_9PROT|nr:multiubiquitin domain-containing protein [Kordiimonas pumila]